MWRSTQKSVQSVTLIRFWLGVQGTERRDGAGGAGGAAPTRLRPTVPVPGRAGGRKIRCRDGRREALSAGGCWVRAGGSAGGRVLRGGGPAAARGGVPGAAVRGGADR